MKQKFDFTSEHYRFISRIGGVRYKNCKNHLKQMRAAGVAV